MDNNTYKGFRKFFKTKNMTKENIIEYLNNPSNFSGIYGQSPSFKVAFIKAALMSFELDETFFFDIIDLVNVDDFKKELFNDKDIRNKYKDCNSINLYMDL
jgi:hypothetical protein